MTHEEMKAYVQEFFDAWEVCGGIPIAYDNFLSDDCIYENSGLDPIVGKDAILKFVKLGGELVDVATMHVKVRKWGFSEDSVFTERVDDHRNTVGDLTLQPAICGVMVFDAGGKISRWSDYYDPAPMLKQLGNSASG